MNHESFWDSNPTIVRAYEKAYHQRMKFADEMMWTMGQYVYRAAYSAIGLIWCDSRFKPNYPERPFTQLQDEEDRYEAELRKALAAEEAYIRIQKRAGLPDTI